MVLAWPAIQYSIKVASILRIWTSNLLIPLIDVELMVRHRLMREGHDSLCIRYSPKENLILTHYMLSAWWLHILDELVQYAIRPETIP